jgi:hypothetical protein
MPTLPRQRLVGFGDYKQKDLGVNGKLIHTLRQYLSREISSLENSAPMWVIASQVGRVLNSVF